MLLKTNVKFGNPILAIINAEMVVKSVYEKYGYDFVITSFNDSTHGVGSLHPFDKAFDVRTKHIAQPQDKELIRRNIREALTADFDIVFEDRGGENEHLHIEYDPK